MIAAPGWDRAQRCCAFSRAAIAVAAALFLCAAQSPPAGLSGKAAGVVAGAFLFVLVSYSLWLYARCQLADRNSGLKTALFILAALAIVKLALLGFFPGFGPDVGSYQAWALDLASVGPAGIYRSGYFLDYPPGYLYALWLVGFFARLLGAGGETLRLMAESPAIVADFLLAASVFVCVRGAGRSKALAMAAMLMVALNPALLYDTVVWGQSDSVMTLVVFLSIMSALDSEFELAWGLGALAVLIKPQGLIYLPVLGVYTLLRSDFQGYWRSALAFVVVAVVGIMPFQIGHPWNWILNLYGATAAYYHETSVNAFNFMALIGGVRQQDSNTILGITYFALGMSLLVPLYLLIASFLWRGQSRRDLFYAAFIAILGFFMFAPRMHERYLYPALVLAVPLAIDEPVVLGLFAVLSLTFLFNLADVKSWLESPQIFMPSHSGPAMVASAVNLFAFAFALYHAFSPIPAESTPASTAPPPGARKPGMSLQEVLAWMRERFAPRPLSLETVAPMQWLRADTMILLVLVGLGVFTRFWRLGLPAEIVFDEVHFVSQARHYISSEPFLDPHPPLAKLLIAVGIILFGDHPWSWRVSNAALGVILVATTYLLGRRMFHSRLAATLSAGCVLLDGFFLVDSRIAVIDIVYLTFAAATYLLLFRFIQTAPLAARRRTLVLLGVTLGLCLGSKLYVPAVTFLLVAGLIAYAVLEGTVMTCSPPSLESRRLVGALLLVSSIAGIFYLATFLPHYALGWWGGIEDMFHYYKDVLWYERSVSAATHPYSSPWWSWPLMLRPVAYWQDFPKSGDVRTIWGGGNPVLWWGALCAIVIVAVRAVKDPSLAACFLSIGYVSYIVIWTPLGRTLFLYHYMPAIYLGYMALGWMLAECWEGKAEPWEHRVLLLPLFPASLLGLGRVWGLLALAAAAAAYAWLVTIGNRSVTSAEGAAAKIRVSAAPSLRRSDSSAGAWAAFAADRLVCAIFVLAAILAFIYYFPVWTAGPISRAGYYARMWLQGPGLGSWI